MSSNLKQLQVTYDLVQDRLCFVFFSLDFCEYRFWLTRRITKGFIELLEKLKKEMAGSEELQKQEERKVAPLIKQERQQPQANKFATQINRTPLGETPLLLQKILVQKTEEGLVLLRFEAIQGQSIEFNADIKLLNVVSQMVHKAVLQSDWNTPCVI